MKSTTVFFWCLCLFCAGCAKSVDPPRGLAINACARAYCQSCWLIDGPELRLRYVGAFVHKERSFLVQGVLHFFPEKRQVRILMLSEFGQTLGDATLYIQGETVHKKMSGPGLAGLRQRIFQAVRQSLLTHLPDVTDVCMPQGAWTRLSRCAGKYCLHSVFSTAQKTVLRKEFFADGQLLWEIFFADSLQYNGLTLPQRVQYFNRREQWEFCLQFVFSEEHL